MPKNCSADAALIAERVDNVFSHGTVEDRAGLKLRLGLRGQTDEALIITLAGQFRRWQSPNISSNSFELHYLCDYVENVFNAIEPLPGSGGVGLEKALDGFAQGIEKLRNGIDLTKQRTGTNLPYIWLLSMRIDSRTNFLDNSMN